MTIEIRPLLSDDIAAADRILKLAFGTPGNRTQELRRCLVLQPDGWRVATCDGQPVGTVGAVDYGPFAWVGLMGVHPAYQHQGIGGLLMADILSWLDHRGCPLVRLDATQAGARLYRKLGFAGAGYLHTYLDPKFEPLLDGSYAVSLARQADLAEVFALDEAIFGASRRLLLEIYWQELPGKFFIARAKNGELAGFLVAQESKLGPWDCTAPQAAEALYRAALALPYVDILRLILPDENLAAGQLFRRLGFAVGLDHLHMVRSHPQLAAAGKSFKEGEPLPGKRALIYAQASFTLG
jgi:predicted N-acetyltransferase YhbS